MKMKKTIFAATVIALALSAGSAFAADLPNRKAPPYIPPPPPPLWTGFYVGLNAGGTWSESNWVNTASFPSFITPAFPVAGPQYAAVSAFGASGWVPVGNTGGFIGGGQVGYNWQFANAFVAGIEADIQGVATSSGNGSVASLIGPLGGFFVPDVVGTSISSTKRLDYLGTVRGRLGYLVTPTLLAYGTGGLAYGGVQSSTSIFQANTDSLFPPGPFLNPMAFGRGAFSDTRVGWTAGGGLEWMFWPNWSAKLEYLYYHLGNVTYSISPLVTTSTFAAAPVWSAVASQSTTRFNGHIVRVGVNYHFNWGAAPVIASY